MTTTLELRQRYADELERLSRARPGAVDEYFAEPLPLLVVRGQGLPLGSDFVDAGRNLRALATEVLRLLDPGSFESGAPVAPIEAVFPSLARTETWQLRVAMPEGATRHHVAMAQSELNVRGKPPMRTSVRAARRTLWLQTVVRQRGAADEGLRMIDGFARSRGYKLADHRHELYLADPGRGARSEVGVIARYRVARPVTVLGRAAALA